MLKGSLQQVGFVLRVIALMWPISSHALETGNLLLNGDAELHRCTKDWTAQTPVPGWRVHRPAHASPALESALSSL